MTAEPPKRRRRRRRRRKPSDASRAGSEAARGEKKGEAQKKAPRRGRGGRGATDGGSRAGREAAGGEKAAGDKKKAPRRGRRRRGKAEGRSRATGPARRKSGGKRRGSTRRRWWSKRWLESLDVIQVGKRLTHGLTYAKQGRVEDLELSEGLVTARVQGSRKAPYQVRMLFGQLGTTDWRRGLSQLAEEIDVAVPLVRGAFPPEVEAAFARIGVSLFPSGPGDLRAACSCPDKANPCKHIAAVFYALGAEIDRDPFVLLQLRGLERAELVEALEGTPASRAAVVATPSEEQLARRRETLARRAEREAAMEAEEAASAHGSSQPLPDDPRVFWAEVSAGTDAPRIGHEEVLLSVSPGALIKRLGGLSFWGGEVGYQATLDRLYDGASAAGLRVYLGEVDPEADETS